MFRFLTRQSRPLSLQRHFSSSPVTGAGHNKWSKIKQKKGVNDAARGAVFGKANRDIVHAIRNGGSADPTKNLALAAVLKWAKEQDVPKENIEKAIVKATQGKGKEGESLTYEALACNSVGVMIECLSDNATRTVHYVRDILNSHGARFAPVKFMFDRKGYVKVASKDEGNLDRVIEAGIEAGAEDFEQLEGQEDGTHELELTCPPAMLAKVTAAVTSPDLQCELLSSELIYAPQETTPASEEVESRLAGLVEALEANEDILRVWTTLDS
ncbi:hypothetical protein AX16_010476 [Volvariella volvacea WC 439]|nr:hypothetical protein AX16_010476 [Volvariella volvacea WC 439]